MIFYKAEYFFQSCLHPMIFYKAVGFFPHQPPSGREGDRDSGGRSKRLIKFILKIIICSPINLSLKVIPHRRASLVLNRYFNVQASTARPCLQYNPILSKFNKSAFLHAALPNGANKTANNESLIFAQNDLIGAVIIMLISQYKIILLDKNCIRVV